MLRFDEVSRCSDSVVSALKHPVVTMSDDRMLGVDDLVALLGAAWTDVRVRDTAPGTDRQTVAQFAAESHRELELLREQLHAGSYQPTPGRRVVIEKDHERPIVIASVRDRVVQRALALLLERRVESRLGPMAHGYRRGLGTGTAISAANSLLAGGRKHFGRTDITKFFDRIDRERLLADVQALGVDKSLVRVVARSLDRGAVEGVSWHDDGVGVPQGSAFSPMLANLYLADVDADMTQRGFSAIRYGDDVLILAEMDTEVGDGIAVLGDALARRALELSGRKTFRGHASQGFTFLGRRFDASGALRSEKTLTALADRLAAIQQNPEGGLGHELFRDFTVWYGMLHAAEIDSGAILAAAALAVDANALVLLAERRRTITPILTPKGHLVLVRRWIGLGRDSMPAMQCALLDARRALLAGAEPGDVASALGVPVPVAEALRKGDPWLVASDFGKAGFITFARAARRLASSQALASSVDHAQPLTREHAANAQAPADSPPITGPDAVGTPAAASGSEDLFRPHDATSALPVLEVAQTLAGWVRNLPLEVEHTNSRGQRQFVATPAAGDVARLAIIEAHCDGRRNAAVGIGRDSTTPLIAIRFAPNQEALRRELPERGALQKALEAAEVQVHEAAVSWLRAATSLGVSGFIEAPGRHDRVVWHPLAGRIALFEARRLFARIGSEIGSPGQAVRVTEFPPSDRVTSAFIGLPLGRNHAKELLSDFVAFGGTRVDRGLVLEHLRSSAPTPVELIFDLLRVGAAAISSSRSGLAPSQVALESIPEAHKIVISCPLMAGLVDKAHRLGHLEPEERASIIEVFGHIPDRGLQAVEAALGPAAGTSRRSLVERLKRLHGHPIGCARLRERHASTLPDHPCECSFKGLHGRTYPTPLLHGVQPRQLDVFKGSPNVQVGAVSPPLLAPKVTTPSPKAPEPRATPAPGPSPVNDAGARATFAVQQLKELCNHRDGIERAIRRHEADLDAIFDELGTDRLVTPAGVLIRIGQRRSRFAWEL